MTEHEALRDAELRAMKAETRHQDAGYTSCAWSRDELEMSSIAEDGVCPSCGQDAEKHAPEE